MEAKAVLGNCINCLRLSFELFKLSFLSELEYRFSFFVKVLGIFANDITFLLIWYLYFMRFPDLNGWHFKETLVLLGLSATSYGWVLMILRGLTQLARTICRGELDYYLSFPVHPLSLHAVSRTDIGSIGDILYALIVFGLYPDRSLAFIVWFLVLAFFGGLVFAAFLILSQSIAFYVANFEDAAEQLWWSMIAFCLYPQSVFDGALRLVMLTVFPAFFMCSLPVAALLEFSWTKLALVASFASCFFVLSLGVFNRGLRRYESGNLISVLR
ncbi:MAG: ABC-2 family transporter protein [Oligoflexia bacterium]|nr:ABC-2 family transporter protein [Oligoflexia bacterium]